MIIKKFLLCLLIGHKWEESIKQPSYYDRKKIWECKKCGVHKKTRWSDSP